MRWLLTAALLMAANALASGQTAAQAGPANTVAPPAASADAAPWDYEGKRGTLEWGKLDPSFKACSQGKEQSPIDIRGAKLDKTLQPIEFHYKTGPVTLVNTGHTVQVVPAPGSYIVANGVRYDLVQFHFHHPGEEAVKGKITDMNVHLVHKSADGKLAVIAVRFNEDLTSPPNTVLAQLFPNLPAKPGQAAKITEDVNPAGLLPADRGYWTYMGSLTAPPCTEGVRWFVFEQEMTLSRTQLAQFAKLYKVNSRGVQDLHGRKITADE